METLDKIKNKSLKTHFNLHEGSPKLPSCGFSARASEALMNCKSAFRLC